jgi:uncharacterized membrane protein YbhN (UPF0104 family)
MVLAFAWPLVRVFYLHHNMTEHVKAGQITWRYRKPERFGAQLVLSFVNFLIYFLIDT